MVQQVQHRQLSDTLVAVAATLQRPSGVVVDLSALKVKFTLVKWDGTVTVAATTANVSVTNATAGQCQYTLQSTDVDEAGMYHAYFVTESASKTDTFPAKQGDFVLRIHPRV